MRRDYIAELWVNRPWVFIPELIALMKKCPYNPRGEYYFDWLWSCVKCCWQFVWKC